MAEAMPSDEELLAELQKLLEKADLTTTTERMLREQLEEKFGVSLKVKKSMIREQVNQYLSQQNGDAEDGGEDGEEEDGDNDEDVAQEGRTTRPKKSQPKKRKAAGSDDKPPPKRRTSTKSTAILSPELQAFLGEEFLPRPQIVKRIWEYIKEHDLKNPVDKRAIICDDKMKTIFTPPINMFSMNKQLSRHIKSAE